MNFKKMLTLAASTLAMLVLVLGTVVVPASGAVISDNSPLTFDDSAVENVQSVPDKPIPCPSVNESVNFQSFDQSGQLLAQANPPCVGIAASPCGSCKVSGLDGQCIAFTCVRCSIR
jgi:hypothetical protein